jgi:multiple RNA-binding domain-containing protein 1
MNISKSDILNPESGDNAAVKLALAETHIIQETKTYLESQGVLLSSFSSRARSDTTILVKNIPYGTTIDQIRELFEPHGELSRVLVPPAGTMAVVEFERPDEAAKGFRAVAYRRLGNSIIYLEKGPLGMFDEHFIPTGKDDSTKTSSNPQTLSSVIRVPEQSIADISKPADSDQDLSIQHGTTLYLKNLAFSTTQDRLVKIFSHLPSFSFARVQTKADPKCPGGRLSMGYGFIGFKDTEGAKKALKSIHNFVLDGHALHVSFAGRGADEPESAKSTTSSNSRTMKMIVKNVPFEATKKDVRALFGYVPVSLLLVVNH